MFATWVLIFHFRQFLNLLVISVFVSFQEFHHDHIAYPHLYNKPWTSFTTGQRSGATVSIQADIMGAVTWDPNYATGVDFLDHNFLSSKNSG